MVIFQVLDQIQRMDQMINTRSTGSPGEFARRLGISVRTLYNYLAIMKERGAPIVYCRTRRSYEYSGQGRFIISFEHIISSAA